MKATEEYFPVVMLIMLSIWFLLLNLWVKSWRVITQMKATEQYFPVVPFITLYAVKVGSNFLVCGWNLKEWPFKWKLLSSTVVLNMMPYMAVLSFKSGEKILKCDYSNKSYWAVLSCCVATVELPTLLLTGANSDNVSVEPEKSQHWNSLYCLYTLFINLFGKIWP